MNRIIGFDLARGLAILAAMTSHAATTLHYQPPVALDFLFRSATPLFIIIFGFFLNKVYLKKIKAGLYTEVRNRLWVRAIQCYVLYCLSTIFLSFHQHYSLAYTVRMLLLLGSTPFTDILRYYAIILFISPFILRGINNRGIYIALLLSAIPHLITFFGLYPPIPDAKITSLLASLIYGGTTLLAGPSLFHSLLFILVGFAISDSITLKNNKPSILLGENSAKCRYILIVSLVVLTAIVFIRDVHLIELSTMKLRNENNLAYFSFGITSSIIIIELSLIISHLVSSKRLKPFLLYGANSLILFSFGNSFLYLLTDKFSYSPLNLLLIEVTFLLMAVTNTYLSNVQAQPMKNIIDFVSVGYARKIIQKLTI